jgi:outer membrane protein OmpA-like peptidoglycan-associated protein
MKRLCAIATFVVVGLLLTANSALSAEQDKAGCKDHPLLTRMNNFYITYCMENEFDSHKFYDKAGNKLVVEGRKWRIDYKLKKGSTPPGALKVKRNFINAVKKIGGEVLKERDKYQAWMKVDKGGKEIWIDVSTVGTGERYYLNIIEKTAMAQEVVADAQTLAQDIQTTGHASVYGIYFDFDKSDIKPESDPALKEIAQLLQQATELKLYVVGHTDNVGEFSYNMKLSQARADAVVEKLVTDYGTSADRLKPHGVGPLAPVSSNKTEEGQALNRRVELVEQ